MQRVFSDMARLPGDGPVRAERDKRHGTAGVHLHRSGYAASSGRAGDHGDHVQIRVCAGVSGGLPHSVHVRDERAELLFSSDRQWNDRSMVSVDS